MIFFSLSFSFSPTLHVYTATNHLLLPQTQPPLPAASVLLLPLFYYHHIFLKSNKWHHENNTKSSQSYPNIPNTLNKHKFLRPRCAAPNSATAISQIYHSKLSNLEKWNKNKMAAALFDALLGTLPSSPRQPNVVIVVIFTKIFSWWMTFL